MKYICTIIIKNEKMKKISLIFVTLIFVNWVASATINIDGKPSCCKSKTECSKDSTKHCADKKHEAKSCCKDKNLSDTTKHCSDKKMDSKSCCKDKNKNLSDSTKHCSDKKNISKSCCSDKTKSLTDSTKHCSDKKHHSKSCCKDKTTK